MPFIKISEQPIKKYGPGISGQMFHVENNTFSQTKFQAGAISPNHKHPMEETISIIEGEMEFTIGKEAKTLSKGEVAIIPSNTMHVGKAISDCTAIEIFNPRLTPEMMKRLGAPNMD